MQYTVMQDDQHPDAGAVIFASSRREYIPDILDGMGLNKVVAELQGMNAYTLYRTIDQLLYQALTSQTHFTARSSPN